LLNSAPIRVERQHPVGAAVEKEQPFVLIDGEAAWIGNTVVVTEGTEQSAIELEGQKRALSVTICAGRACHEEKHLLEKHLLWIRPNSLIIGLSRVDARVLGFFMFLFYTFQQVYCLPMIFDCTLGARAAAKRQKADDWQDYHCMKTKSQLLVHDTSTFALCLNMLSRAFVRDC
jgi:hypothetical protein